MEKYVSIGMKIETIISETLEIRGMAGIKLHNQLLNTAVDLNNSDVIVIVTGFYIHKAGIGETDGPLGALSMANALCQLAKKVIIVTDEHSAKFIEIGIDRLEIDAILYVVSSENALELSEEIIDKYRPDHVIAIERPGKSKEGKYHSMSGEDITEFVPDLDYLFEIARENGIKTSAIGDGGNEIGMGRIMDYILSNVHQGEKIASVTETDNLIIAGVSNWGGHGVCAILSVLNGKNLLYDDAMEQELIEAIVFAGAVDGCTKTAEFSVDGYGMDANKAIINRFKALVEQEISKIDHE